MGNLAVSGEAVLAAAAAVITAVVLDNKRELHQALQKLQEYASRSESSFSTSINALAKSNTCSDWP